MKGIGIIMGSLSVLTRACHWLTCSADLTTTYAEFPFEKYSTVVDIGGGIGAFSLPLAKKHKHIKITIHDLPEVVAQARAVSILLHVHPMQLSNFHLGLDKRLSRGSQREQDRVRRA